MFDLLLEYQWITILEKGLTTVSSFDLWQLFKNSISIYFQRINFGYLHRQQYNFQTGLRLRYMIQRMQQTIEKSNILIINVGNGHI